jgi:hypothetical protein
MLIPAETWKPAADDIASDNVRQSLAYSWKIAFEALPHAVVQRPALLNFLQRSMSTSPWDRESSK